HAGDPYFLYAASNLGSLTALLSYPFVLEPIFGLKTLSALWRLGFLLLAALLAACFLLMRRVQPRDTAALADQAEARRPAAADRLGWAFLALVPAGLLTAFTTHISVDVASAPLIWVLPLALYLATFVVVFRERPLIPRTLLLALHLIAVALA